MQCVGADLLISILGKNLERLQAPIVIYFWPGSF
jgi:hypothetical protein